MSVVPAEETDNSAASRAGRVRRDIDVAQAEILVGIDGPAEFHVAAAGQRQPVDRDVDVGGRVVVVDVEDGDRPP